MLAVGVGDGLGSGCLWTGPAHLAESRVRMSEFYELNSLKSAEVEICLPSALIGWMHVCRHLSIPQTVHSQVCAFMTRRLLLHFKM